jgi:soluble lytic murein transglycosylase-like protein
MRVLLIVIVLTALLIFVLSKEGYRLTGKLNDEQKKYRDLIRDQAQASRYQNFFVLQGLALTESSLDPSAHSKKNSYGLFQIYHAANFSWLRSFGYSDSDLNKLYDPVFNTQIAIRVVRYFEGKGYKFPAQADIYNVGETEWAKGVRNESYRQKVIEYSSEFAEGKL